jgi:hypothetical protein
VKVLQIIQEIQIYILLLVIITIGDNYGICGHII